MTVVDGRVLVTGASGGIGRAIATAFHERGATLLLSGRRLEALGSLAAVLSAQTIAADLGDPADVARLAEQAADIDVLVLNAALPASGDLLELTPEQIDKLLEVNLRAPIALARALAPAMVARRRGHIVFISSLSAKAASPSASLYNATKFGLRGFALGAREDLRPAGVGVSLVAPGFVGDAGMYADTGIKLPFGVGTSSSKQVADAVIRAVERNRAEITVAPWSLRISTDIAAVAPALSARFQRLMGGAKVARAIADAQVDKRP